MPFLASPSRRQAVTDAFLIVLALAAALAAIDLLALPVWGHDMQAHQRWQWAFAAQLLQGEPYPRWLAALNEGFGSPAFFVYPPLAHYAAAFFLWVPGADAMRRVDLSMAAALLASGLAMLAWLRTLLGRGAALAGALLYMLMPYHVYVDWYRRAALSELWAFVWLPLALLALGHARERPLRALLACSTVVAALLCTHPPTTLVLLPAIALLPLATGGGWRTAAIAAASLAFGAALAAVYLLPALAHEPFTNMQAMFTQPMTFRRWLLWQQHSQAGCGIGHHPHGCQLAAVAWMQYAAAAVLFAASLSAHVPAHLRRWLFACAAGSALLLFMMSVASGPVWEALAVLQKMQFPWRMLALQCFLLAVPAAILVDAGSPVARVTLAVLCLSLLVLAASDRYGGPLGHEHERRPPLRTLEVEEYRLGDARQMLALFPAGAQAVVVDGSARVAVRRWQPRDIALQVNAQRASRIALRQLNDRGWTYGIAGREARSTALSSAVPVAVIEVPAGTREVELRLEAAAPERAGAWISGFAAAAWAALLAALLLRRPGVRHAK